MTRITIHSDLIKKVSILVIIACLFLVLRFQALNRDSIPFVFDHGKDSIAVLSMIVNQRPQLIGPWTSIPGVYFGPGWYYLLLPGFVFTKGDPASAVWTMVILGFLQVLLIWKFWGSRAAMIAATVPLYVIASTSAWNPFPMTILTFGILAVTWRMQNNKAFIATTVAILGLLAGLGFHFSAAYAIFYVPAILILTHPFLLRPFKNLVIFLLALGATFAPQFIFEIRHDFIQLKSLISYFSAGESQAISPQKIWHVLSTTTQETRLILPTYPDQNKSISLLILSAMLLLFCFYLYRWWNTASSHQKRWLLRAFVGFVLIPTAAYCFLHFNVWYLYGSLPVFSVIIFLAVRMMPRPVFLTLMAISIATVLWNVSNDLTFLPESHLKIGTLKAKELVISQLRDKASGQPFAVYVYQPDIYDFAYSYLWLRDGYRGLPLPTEFSYMPGARTYSQDKEKILVQLPEPAGEPRLIFYVVEKPQVNQFLQDWWNQMPSGDRTEIPSSVDGVRLYVQVVQ